MSCGDEWDFPGFVMSDYAALHGTDGALDGTDQEQPFNTNFGATLQTYVQDGVIPVAVLNSMVSPDPHRDVPVQAVQPAAHRVAVGHRDHARTQALANKVAEAGTTLLKNDPARCRCRTHAR